MRWRRVGTGPVSDRRTSRVPVRAGGGLGVAAAIVMAVLLATGVLDGEEDGGGFGGIQSPFETFPERPQPGYGEGRQVPGAPDPEQELVDFVRFVSADLQTFWQQELAQTGEDYDPAEVVLFRSRIRSGCGPASSSAGPFYCPADQRVYLDLAFFRDLAGRFGAPGDFAQAYVVAHEFGHHLQTLTGLTGQVDRAASDDPARASELSVRRELMADCLAGVWGHSTYERGLLETGDYEEGLRAAAAVGDDRLQRQAVGRVAPETFTHGTSEQRSRWFAAGFDAGDATACDTFGRPLD